jgi:hypothetical protein
MRKTVWEFYPLRTLNVSKYFSSAQHLAGWPGSLIPLPVLSNDTVNLETSISSSLSAFALNCSYSCELAFQFPDHFIREVTEPS